MDPHQLWHWVGWASWSAYSPRNLSHLPQPTPKDAPSDIQRGVFTFEDAFEDLLAVNSGQELPDIKTKYEMRRLLARVFPDGEDSRFWVRRLHSQRLLGPASDFSRRWNPGWDERAWDSMVGSFGESDGRDDERRGLARRSQAAPQADSKRGEAEDSDALGEAISTVQSNFSQGTASMSALMKLASESWEEVQRHAREATATPFESTRRESNLSQVESSEEHTDKFGNIHVTRTIRTLDEDGYEVGKEVYVRIQSPGPWLSAPNQPNRRPGADESVTYGETAQKGSRKEEHDVGEPGWFWK